MQDASRDHEPLTRQELHTAPFEVDEQPALHDLEELILAIVLVPMELSQQDAQTDD